MIWFYFHASKIIILPIIKRLFKLVARRRRKSYKADRLVMAWWRADIKQLHILLSNITGK